MFDCSFIRETVKSFEVITFWCFCIIYLTKESVRQLYLHSERGLFAKEQDFVTKNDIGGINFWPIENFDMV